MKLLRMALLLMVINTGLIIVVRMASGMVAAPSDFERLLRQSDGVGCSEPCFLGVRIGTTSFAEIPALYATHSLTSGMHIVRGQRAIQAINQAGNVYTATCCGINRSVEQMSWSGRPDNSPFRAADALDTLGRPDCVLLNSGSYMLYFARFELEISVVHSTKRRLNLGDPITLIVLYQTNANINCDTAASLAWQGFRAVLSDAGQ